MPASGDPRNERLDLLLHQQTRSGRQHLGDVVDRRLLAVHDAEAVRDKDSDAKPGSSRFSANRVDLKV